MSNPETVEDAVRHWDEAMAAVQAAVHDADYAALCRQMRRVRLAFRDVHQLLGQPEAASLPATLRERLQGGNQRLEQLQRDVSVWRDDLQAKIEQRAVGRRVSRAYHPNHASLCGRDVRIRTGKGLE
ncbi:MAG: hypothetical protein A3K19_19515 [Lentisphaerae bacterium RIFOXYB12_FULL_65_16]|nr:MAG: hypothetical protein A3K18_31300 [Lentisphaerae bacterium RIFOXYA12_64_32]OGV92051.1 MAG: hypothetical protein A3K19_19515 [Lentisphaerae bacterium RIFOXYB12_FULL_65_16]